MSEKQGNPGHPEGQEGIEMLRRMNEGHAPLRKWGLPFVDWKEDMHILDVGCGGGATIADMLLLSPGSIVEGVDYAPESVKSSEAFNEKYLENRCFVKQGDVTNLPYEDGIFDLVTAVETIYFWTDIDKALSEIFRVLKPGGCFMVLCEACNPDIIKEWTTVRGFFKVYNEGEYKDIFKKARFESVETMLGPGQYIAARGIKPI